MILTGAAVVGDYSPMKGKDVGLRIDKDEYINAYKILTDVVHKYNSIILLQLSHFGLYSSGEIIYGPSLTKGLTQDKNSKEMTLEDIERIEDYFVKGALRAKQAGFDGIELHGGHLGLISSFLSPVYNRRTDEYGGSDEKRAKFLIDIIKKIREKIGNDMILMIKIDSEGEQITEKGFLTVAKMAEDAGVDLIELTGHNPMKNERLYFFEASKKLAETISIPVVYIGGVKTFEDADFVIKNSKIEYVSLVRALIKQPDLVKKWTQNNQM